MPATTAKKNDIQSKIVANRNAMTAALIERDEEIDLVHVALLCGEHALLVGPPGTAKSLTVDSLQSSISGARKLTIHCCKDTTRTAAFGPVKRSAFLKDEAERNLSGGAADVHFLILEEVFKAGPAVLDMFLLLMQDRVYREGLMRADCPLLMLLGVSNEWSPEGCETALGAFFDRFLLRKSVRYIRGQKRRRQLAAIPVLGRPAPDRTHKPKFASPLTLEEVRKAQAQVAAMPFSLDADIAYWDIIDTVQEAGIQPGDRRIVKSIAACQANAYLAGSTIVQPEHLEVLSHILWIDPVEQPAKVARLVAKIANPVGMFLTDKDIQIEAIMKTATPGEAVEKLKEIQAEMSEKASEHADDLRLQAAMTHVADCIKQRSYDKTGITNPMKGAF